MATYTLNNTTLSFTNIFFVSSSGLDSYSGLDRDHPLKTIQAAINKCGTVKSAVILLKNSVFEGQLNDIGFVNVPASSQITVIGEFDAVSEMPIIRGTDYNTIRNLSSGTTFIRCRIESNGTCSSGGNDSYAELCTSSSVSIVTNFYNCYLKPRGFEGFVFYGTFKFYNCIVDYNSHAFAGTAYGDRSTITSFSSCIFLGSMTCRSDSLAATAIDCIRTASVPYTTFNNTSIYKSDLTLDTNLKPTNYDSTFAGLYSGIYRTFQFKYLFYDNSRYKIYNTTTQEWTTLPQIETLTKEYIQTYGMNSLDNVDISTLIDQSNITIKQYSLLDNVDNMILDGYKQSLPLLYSNNNIDLTDKFILSIVLTTFPTLNTDVGYIISFDSGVTWYGYDIVNNKFKKISDINNMTIINQYKLTCDTSFTKEQIQLVRKSSNTIRFAFYFGVSYAAIDSLTMTLLNKDTWNLCESTSYSYTVFSDSVQFKFYNSNSYKINYYKQDVPIRITEPIALQGISSYDQIQNKPSEFIAESHEHQQSEITNLVSILNTKANSNHTHNMEHTHTNLQQLELINKTETNIPMWNGENWPGSAIPLGIRFITLSDTPSSYDGTNGEFICVNNANTALIFKSFTLSSSSSNPITEKPKSIRYAFLYGGG